MGGQVGDTMPESRRLDRLTSMMRRRGIVFPSFEIYGGVAGLVDYDRLGLQLSERLSKVGLTIGLLGEIL